MAHIRSYAPTKPCEYCDTPFAPRKDGQPKGHGRFCSIGCANSSRKSPPPLDQELVVTMYIRDRRSIDQIAKAVGSNRRSVRASLITQGVELRSGGYLPIENLARTTYRKEASKNIGRKLKNGETVHHVNLDQSDNSAGNLAVLASRREHQLAHWKLQSLAAELVKADLIQWKGNTYIFSGKMEGLLKYAERQ